VDFTPKGLSLRSKSSLFRYAIDIPPKCPIRTPGAYGKDFGSFGRYVARSKKGHRTPKKTSIFAYRKKIYALLRPFNPSFLLIPYPVRN
jgi:hypothetical protein